MPSGELTVTVRPHIVRWRYAVTKTLLRFGLTRSLLRYAPPLRIDVYLNDRKRSSSYYRVKPTFRLVEVA